MKIGVLGYFNDDLMAFVITCLFCGAISKEEFNTWCAQAISMNKTPKYLYDLMDFHGEIFKIYKIVGYVPIWDHTEVEERALYGIAVHRGFMPYDMSLTPEKAIDCLDASKDVKQAFCQVFNFIRL